MPISPPPWLLALTWVLAPVAAHAGCSAFFPRVRTYQQNIELQNTAAQVVLMRKGQRTVMTMSMNYIGPPEDFAMIVPVPVVLKPHQIQPLPGWIFTKLDRLSAPRLLERWELDPCAMSRRRRIKAKSASGRMGGDFGGRQATPQTVHVEATFSKGQYAFQVLSASESQGLARWLTAHDYALPDGAAEALAPYVRSGMKFVVAKVNPKKARRLPNGDVVLAPVRFHFEDVQLRLPVRLGLLNSPGIQDLVLYVLHPTQRFEVANYTTVPVPTNLSLAPGASGRFNAVHTALVDRTIRQADGRAIALEYARQQPTDCTVCSRAQMLLNRDLWLLGGAKLGVPADDAIAPWVLTRLHARYDHTLLNEDLILAPAQPIASRTGSAVPHPARRNAFISRYEIRHPWTGPATCRAPRRGVWAGRPRPVPKATGAVDLNALILSRTDL